jgi:CRISPR system Cascade subunit CasB
MPNMASNPAAANADPATAEKPDDWMTSISRQTHGMSSGDRAALRRMELTKSPGADAVAIKMLLRAQVPPSRVEDDWTRLRLIGHFAGLLSGTAALYPHDERRGVGAALFEAGFSEKRLLRLLASRAEALGDQLALAVRILSRERQPVNLWDLYHLLGGDPVKSDAARLRMARHYYAAQAKSN